MTSDNIFQALPKNLDQEVFDLLLDAENLKIERIVSKGHSAAEGEWQCQQQSEWVLLLAGAAVLAFEGAEDVHLAQGSYLNIPAGSRHRVKWTDLATETIWLAVHY